MSTHAQRIQEKAFERRWIILVVLCVSLLVIVLDNLVKRSRVSRVMAG